MTSKPKSKAPPTNFFARVWRELLFTREFYYEVDASPEACADAIQEHLNTAKRQDGYRQVVEVEVIATDHYRFKAEATRPSRNGQIITATTSGSIQQTDGKTMVEGEAHFGAANYTMLLIVGLFFVMIPVVLNAQPSVAVSILYTGSILLILGWTFIHPFTDRNRLVREIEHIAQAARDENMLRKAKPTFEDYSWSEDVNGQHSDASAARKNQSSS